MKTDASKKKILIVFPYYMGPDSTGSSGVKRIVLELLNGFDKERYEFFIAAPARGPFDDDFQSQGASMFYLGEKKHLVMRRSKNPFYILVLYPLFLLKCAFRLLSFIKRENIDLVFSHSSAFLGGAIAAKLARVRSIMVIHETFFYLPLCLWRFLNRIVLALNDKTVLISSIIEPLFKFKNTPPEKTTLIFNGIDPSKFAAANESGRKDFREKHGTPADAKVIGFLGRICFKKGVEYIIESMKYVISENEDTYLLIVGGPDETEDFPYEKSLKKQVEELGLSDRVIFTGPTLEAEKALAAFDIFAFASVEDTAPRAILEAMAARLPVVSASETGSLDMVVHNVTGLNVEPKNPRALADGILLLLDNDELRPRFGENGLSRVENVFSYRTMTAKYEALFNELLELYS